jgi:hypothetical protein
MKRVRYVIGAAGLAPVALTGAVLPTAHAVAAPQAASQAAKTVSLHHAGAVTPDASCTGKTEVNLKQTGNIKAHFWYTYDAVEQGGVFQPGTCIGTIVASMYFTKNLCKTVSVRVDKAEANRFKNICGTAGHWYHMSWGLHANVASRPVSVCEDSTFHSHFACVST